MIYYLDCEFNEFGGELISLALVREDGAALYLLYPIPENIGTWVSANVMPHITHCPITPLYVNQVSGARAIVAFLKGDPEPNIIADWPDDISYFCRALMTGPGMMVKVDNIQFSMFRVEAYPTTLEGAIQHNAYWDAMALRHYYGK